jgi:parallel beta-helix repeat protein
MAITFNKNCIVFAATVLLSSMTGLLPYQQQQQQPLHFGFTAEAGEVACIDYDEGDNTITINCNTSFLDVVRTINDPDILQNLSNGEYILNANVVVADGVIFSLTSSDDGLQYLKIAGENGIIVHGQIMINGVTITSWDISDEEVIPQNINGTIRRGYIQFAGSEGSQIINSEFGYLGDVEPGRRGFDLYGEGPSHSMLIRSSKFHDMWMAFYSREAYNITVDGNEYYNNIRYALDPHTITYDMNITNNWVHHNPIGIICSDRCYNILIEGNLVEHNIDSGIYFSRNMHDSTARNNHVLNTTSGIIVSESPNNQIYDNTIEGATSQGIRLFNPELPDDGLTDNNLVFNNSISDSENGIMAIRSHDNTVANTTFSDIEESEYTLSGNSSMVIREQHFDNALISDEGSEIGSQIEIASSGTIEVIGGQGGGGEDEDGDDDEEDPEDGDEEEEDEGEGELYNTDIEPYTNRLGDGDSIRVIS